VKLLYVSPERLGTRSLASLLAGTEVARIAVDEAHCVSEWGHDFRPAYRRIADFRHRVGWPPCIALTATATPATRRDVVTSLRLRRPVMLVWPADRPNLRWEVRKVRSTRGAAEILVGTVRAASGAAIVYVRTRSAALRMAEALRRSGRSAAAYHAGMDASSRQAVQDAFLEGRLGAVCATTAFGMGIDHPRVRLVGHLGRPASLEAYVQEAGRAGRDEQPARCLLVARDDDERFHLSQQARSWPPRSLARSVWRAMPAGRPVTPGELAGIGRIASAERLEDALAFFERFGAARHSSGRSRAEGAREGAWVRGPDALWRRLAAELRTGRERARGRLAAMRRYVDSSGCRRHAIARYFGNAPPRCRGCDRCDAAAR
jgi:ATP-dependent DNA helicase RecQ